MPALGTAIQMPLDDLPPYLPTTGDALDALDAEETITCAVEQLEPLSGSDDASFWDATAGGASALQVFLDGYLRFAERRFALTGDESDTTEDSASLRRLVLRILLRLAKPPASHMAWAERFFTVPRLIDACALYAFTDKPGCERLAAVTMGPQPAAKAAGLHASLGDAATAICRVCGFDCVPEGAAGAVRTALLPSALDVQTAEDAAIVGDWLLDATGTLHALSLVLPPAALHAATSGLSKSSTASDSSVGAGRMGATSLVPLCGVGGVVTALQLTVEVALPWLRRAATPAIGVVAGSAVSTLHDRLVACGLHCLHAAANLILASCFEPVGAATGAASGAALDAVADVALEGGRGHGARGGEGSGRGGKGGGGKGKGDAKGKGAKGGSGGRGSSGQALVDLEALSSVLLQLSDPCETLEELEPLYVTAQVPPLMTL